MSEEYVVHKDLPIKDAANALLSADAVRDRCNEIYRLGQQNSLLHFQIVPNRLAPTVDYVVDVIHENYPSLNIPFHSRLRHFEAGGVNRINEFKRLIFEGSSDEKARTWFDLVIISVLMDAGAGPLWQYNDQRHGGIYTRSEGLGVLSYNLFCEGWFSSNKKFPHRVDGQRLSEITAQNLTEAMGITAKNPLVGIHGRCQLINNLGRYICEHPKHFMNTEDKSPRLGNLFHAVTNGQSEIAAKDLLKSILLILGPIWPSRLSLGGIPLGDTWHHPLVQGNEITRGLVPFHKLSQWLSYSLMEVLTMVGVTVHEPDALTGLAEYRNGGLLLDMGLIALKEPEQKNLTHTIDSPLIIEWRALTVALLDVMAEEIRKKLKLDKDTLPLVKILEGGTWSAGRKIAKQQRSDGSQPLKLASDGTVF